MGDPDEPTTGVFEYVDQCLTPTLVRMLRKAGTFDCCIWRRKIRRVELASVGTDRLITFSITLSGTRKRSLREGPRKYGARPSVCRTISAYEKSTSRSTTLCVGEMSPDGISLTTNRFAISRRRPSSSHTSVVLSR